ncbi:hypothetical protein NL492_26530, partial [Klebsiella pneumoniae]|nr:hypothetical protein [Klebsiella pneumoniae]
LVEYYLPSQKNLGCVAKSSVTISRIWERLKSTTNGFNVILMISKCGQNVKFAVHYIWGIIGHPF